MENNIVEDNSMLNYFHQCNKCTTLMNFDTTEEDEENFLYLVYLCPNCENKKFVLDKDKKYYKDIYEHLKNLEII